MSDERSLIRRCKQRDEKAFAEMVQLKREKVFRIAVNIVGDEDDAKDIAQLAFVKLWRSISSFKESARFDPWFFRIVVNLSLDHCRRKKRETILSESAQPVAEPQPGAMDSVQDAAIYRAQIREIFNEAAARLTEQQRAAFTLREIEGLSTEDVGKAMGIRASTVRNHVLQARRTLQQYLQRRFPELAQSRDQKD